MKGMGYASKTGLSRSRSLSLKSLAGEAVRRKSCGVLPELSEALGDTASSCA